MSKVVFADGSEVEVNDVSSVFCITLDTVDPVKVKEFQEKLTIANLKSFKIVNPDPTMCSEGVNFKFVEVEDRARRLSMMGNPEGEVPEITSTMFMCRPLNEIEMKLLALFDSTDSNASAIQDLADVVTSLL